MKPDWTLIANATTARLLQQQGDGPMVVIRNFTHPQGRTKVSDLVKDHAGRESTGRSFGGGAAFQPHTEVKHKEHERFARELAEYLEHEALQGKFGKLQIFASSPFLGELKGQVGDATLKLVAGAHPVDLTAVGVTELKRRIAHELAH